MDRSGLMTMGAHPGPPSFFRVLGNRGGVRVLDGPPPPGAIFSSASRREPPGSTMEASFEWEATPDNLYALAPRFVPLAPTFRFGE